MVDSSGLKIHLTGNLRKYEAGIMELGLIYNDWMAIPPGQQSFVLKGYCAPQCTAMGLESGGILVFGSQLHTHGAGRQVWRRRANGRLLWRLSWRNTSTSLVHERDGRRGHSSCYQSRV